MPAIKISQLNPARLRVDDIVQSTVTFGKGIITRVVDGLIDITWDDDGHVSEGIDPAKLDTVLLLA